MAYGKAGGNLSIKHHGFLTLLKGGLIWSKRLDQKANLFQRSDWVDKYNLNQHFV